MISSRKVLYIAELFRVVYGSPRRRTWIALSLIAVFALGAGAMAARLVEEPIKPSLLSPIAGIPPASFAHAVTPVGAAFDVSSTPVNLAEQRLKSMAGKPDCFSFHQGKSII